MQASNRIIVNTLAQYCRTIINLLLSLYSARLVLDILGVEDFGIYSLVAGVVSMLSFLTNSLVTSTQRFLSVSQGTNNLERLKEVFCNSLVLHVVLGLIITLALECLTPLLFNGFLNIPDGRDTAAVIIYQQVIFMVYVSFIASPYRALLVSRENIVYTSIVDVLDGVLKLVLVIALIYLPYDKLVAYGWIMFAIRISNLLAFAIYTHFKYEECILPKVKYLKYSYVKELSSFTGWIMYSSGCIALRNQGFAIVLNKTLGTAINAAYGIGAQIAGMVSFVSSSFNNALAPQLMAAKGGGNSERMWQLSYIECKISFLLLAMVAIPTMFEMQALLELWLKEVPQSSMMFGCMFLSMQTIDLLTTGLGTVNRATGKIGMYTLATFTPKLFALPLCWIVLYFDYSLLYACLIVVLIETISMLLRIPMIRKAQGFNSWDFISNVILKVIPPVILSVLICVLITISVDSSFRFILTYMVAIPLFAFAVYKFSLNEVECNKLKSIVSALREKI